MSFASVQPGIFLIIFLILLAVGVYLLPTIVAVFRKVVNVGSVAVINILLGWTFVGWVTAMAMAARSNPAGATVNVQTVVGAHPEASRLPDHAAMAAGAVAPGMLHRNLVPADALPQHEGSVGPWSQPTPVAGGPGSGPYGACPGCHRAIRDGQKFCGFCGSPA